MRRSIILAIILSSLWWIFSGKTISLVLMLGVASVVTIVLVVRRMDRFAYHNPNTDTYFSVRYIPYTFWIIKEIIMSNFSVAWTILGIGNKVAPVIFDAFAHEETEFGSIAYANSITITPGTVTMALVDGRITVHALTEEAKQGLLEGDMDSRVHYAETGRSITAKVEGEQ